MKKLFEEAQLLERKPTSIGVDELFDYSINVIIASDVRFEPSDPNLKRAIEHALEARNLGGWTVLSVDIKEAK